MFGIVGGEARRRPGYSPWIEALVWTLVVLVIGAVVAGGIALSTDWFSGKNTPTVQPFDSAQGKPVQLAPVVVAPVIPTFRIHAKGPWVQIGTARNGDEVMKLPIPWDQLVRKMTPENKALVLELEKLDRPLDVEGKPGAFIGYLPGHVTSIFAYTSKDSHTLSYWKREVTIEGSSP